MTPEELADLLARSYSFEGWSDLGNGPLLAVLDTSCVRTGLRHQLLHGSLPASVSTARDGSVRMLMEYETLVETGRKLPKFAKDLGVPTAELTRNRLLRRTATGGSRQSASRQHRPPGAGTESRHWRMARTAKQLGSTPVLFRRSGGGFGVDR